MGPAIGGKPSSESFSILQQAGNGDFKTGAPRLGFGVVDVREVAEAHLAAAFTPEANSRNIISGHNTIFLEVLLTLRDRFGKDYGLPKGAAPKFLVWMIAPFVGLERKFVSRNANHAWKADNSKSIRELSLTYRPMKETMEDMFQYMIDAGYFKKK